MTFENLLAEYQAIRNRLEDLHEMFPQVTELSSYVEISPEGLLYNFEKHPEWFHDQESD